MNPVIASLVSLGALSQIVIAVATVRIRAIFGTRECRKCWFRRADLAGQAAAPDQRCKALRIRHLHFHSRLARCHVELKATQTSEPIDSMCFVSDDGRFLRSQGQLREISIAAARFCYVTGWWRIRSSVAHLEPGRRESLAVTITGVVRILNKEAFMPRTFAATIITEVEFVGGDSSDLLDQNYLKHLTEELEKAANRLSLRAIKGLRVTFCSGGIMRPA